MKKRLGLILILVLTVIMLTACSKVLTEAGKQTANAATNASAAIKNNNSQEKRGTATFTNNEDGTMTLKYNNTDSHRCKLVIQLEGGTMYQYDIPKGENELTFPLSEGNGKYKIYLCRNTTDDKYSIEESTQIEQNLSDELLAFIGSNIIVDWNTTNEAIKKAQILTTGLTEDDDKLKAIYDYTVENYDYDFDKAANISEVTKNQAYVPDIDKTYEAKMGICYDISSLMASMLRSVDIPAKVVTGYTTTTVSYHAWNHVYYTPNGEWKVMDVTYDVQKRDTGATLKMFKNPKEYPTVIYTY